MKNTTHHCTDLYFIYKAVVLKVGGADTLPGGRNVTDGEKKTSRTYDCLVKAPSVAKCKGLD